MKPGRIVASPSSITRFASRSSSVPTATISSFADENGARFDQPLAIEEPVGADQQVAAHVLMAATGRKSGERDDDRERMEDAAGYGHEPTMRRRWIDAGTSCSSSPTSSSPS
jgi:hypothetical protein